MAAPIQTCGAGVTEHVAGCMPHTAGWPACMARSLDGRCKRVVEAQQRQQREADAQQPQGSPDQKARAAERQQKEVVLDVIVHWEREGEGRPTGGVGPQGPRLGAGGRPPRAASSLQAAAHCDATGEGESHGLQAMEGDALAQRRPATQRSGRSEAQHAAPSWGAPGTAPLSPLHLIRDVHFTWFLGMVKVEKNSQAARGGRRRSASRSASHSSSAVTFCQSISASVYMLLLRRSLASVLQSLSGNSSVATLHELFCC
jgi:hypothetical protein